MSLLQRGCIKSVQRGFKVIRGGDPNQPLTINISPIDPNKSLLLFDVYLASGSSSSDRFKFMTTNLLQSSIVITNTSTREYSQTMGSGDITEFALSYQVVEFY